MGADMHEWVGRAVAQIEARAPMDRAVGDRAAEALAPYAEAAEALCATELAGVASAGDVGVAMLVELWDTGSPTERALADIGLRLCRAARARSRDVLAEDGVLDEMTPAHVALRGRLLDERDQLVERAATAVLDARQHAVARLRWIEHRARADVARALSLDVDEVCRLLEACRPRMRAELERLLRARRPRSRVT